MKINNICNENSIEKLCLITNCSQRFFQNYSGSMSANTENMLSLKLDSFIPTIGVLCIDIAKNLTTFYGTRYCSYIAASYVKFLESSGAHTVPVWIGKDRSYYEDIMSKINGILLPGGAVFFEDQPPNAILTNNCVLSSKWICEIAKEKNLAGEYFPIWGICLGFQLLILNDVGDAHARIEIPLVRNQSNVKLEPDIKTSKLFKQLSENLLQVMSNIPFAHFFHRYCITVEKMNTCEKLNKWRILATENNGNILYVTIAEHTEFPFYGVQFHPERIAYEIFNGEDCNYHTIGAIDAVDYFSKFFVNECRRNTNRFHTENERLQHLIYNFNVFFTANVSRYLQCYLFTNNEKYADDISFAN